MPTTWNNGFEMVVKIIITLYYVTHICKDTSNKHECIHTYVENDLC